MDNGYKIKNRDSFVDELLENFKVEKTFSGNKYKVEEEFPKTSRNRVRYFWRKMWLPLLVTLAVVIAMTAAIAFVVNGRNSRIALDVTTFEDLNLSNLLSRVSDANKKYEAEKKELERLKAEWDSLVQQSGLNRDAEIFTVDSLNLESMEEAEKMKQEILAKYSLELEELNARYEAKIEAQKLLVEESKIALDDFQNQNEEAMEKARQSAALSSQTLIQLQQKQLQSQYESELEGIQNQLAQVQEEGLERQQQALSSVSEKYQAQIGRLDPDLSGTAAEKISSGVKTDSMSRNYLSQVWITRLDDKAGDGFKSALSLYEKQKADSKILQDELQSAVGVEHRNSIPKFLSSLSRLNNQADNGFAQAAVEEVNAHIQIESEMALQIAELTEQVESDAKALEEAEQKQLELVQKNTYLEEQIATTSETSALYENALDALCDKDGIVLGCENQSRVEVYVVKSRRQFAGDAAVLDGNKIVAVGKVSYVESTGKCWFKPGDYSVGKKDDVYSISSYKSDEEGSLFENKEVGVGNKIVLLKGLPEKPVVENEPKKWWPF